ncbi:secondary thiamine-phosphate synthase enzyme YjbQ [Shewanella olleyana]|uniref:secondary thiamine-phosphate synthase enzyme YjbQ n=1 Tax=Shewanella olleyana TaxID=135626 RepID=UPI00200D9804|nr:secondary thiamine-phosphate synthase enzyme YjbQ [Shewanella olleyana]MCL1065537.1 secondary thiamine-phosphate synthase enzyme YjbQ [Shewanella olleyana]
MWFQKQINLKSRPRGFHLITDEILQQIPELANFSVGIMHVFLQHTSASITINENADPSVRQDFESYFNRTAAENETYYVHTYEGSDDMPAHLKSSLLGCELSIPISQGQLAVGMWQGIYLGEHRNHGGSRQVLITIQGE